MKLLYLGGNDLRSNLEMLFFMGMNMFRMYWFTLASNCIFSVISACSASITSPAIKQSINENIFRCISFVSFSFIVIMANATSSLYMAHSGGSAELAEMIRTVSIVALSSRKECAMLMLPDGLPLLRHYILPLNTSSRTFLQLYSRTPTNRTTHQSTYYGVSIANLTRDCFGNAKHSSSDRASSDPDSGISHAEKFISCIVLESSEASCVAVISGGCFFGCKKFLFFIKTP